MEAGLCVWGTVSFVGECVGVGVNAWLLGVGVTAWLVGVSVTGEGVGDGVGYGVGDGVGDGVEAAAFFGSNV